MAERIFGQLAEWTSLDDEASQAGDRRLRRVHAGSAGARVRAAIVRAHDRDAGRAQDSDAARLRRAIAQALSVRGQRPGAFQGHRRERIEAAARSRRATRRSPRSSAAPRERGRARSGRARSRAPSAFDDLLKEALSRAETFSATTTRTLRRRALRRRWVCARRDGGERRSRDARRRNWARAAREMGERARGRQEQRPGIRGEAFARRTAKRPREARGRGAARRVFHRGRQDGKAAAEARTGHLTTKDLRERFPPLEDDLRREQDRLTTLRERRRAALTLERSAALFVVATAILATFARMKAERGALDFDDQIARALALVTRSSAAWVLHKLDYGLDHLLLDEAQDASAPQWGILAALSAEFFAGAGARALEPHRLCGRRREAVDLRLPGRGARDVRGNEARFRQASSRRRTAVRRRAADLLVPVVANDSRRRRHDLRHRARPGAASPPPGSRRQRIRRSAAT